jgi:hypothetical protein
MLISEVITVSDGTMNLVNGIWVDIEREKNED